MSGVCVAFMQHRYVYVIFCRSCAVCTDMPAFAAACALLTTHAPMRPLCRAARYTHAPIYPLLPRAVRAA